MPQPDDKAADKVRREQERELRKAERKTENERRKAAREPQLPEDPDDDAPHPDQTLP